MAHELPKTAAYDPSAAQYYLTLRYNPLLEATLPRIKSSDMRPLQSPPPSPKMLQDMIVKSMSETFNKISVKSRIAVSLSGGVDSTLMLALLRKNFPNLKVTAISVRFDDAYDETDRAAHTAQTLDVDHVVVNVDDHMKYLPDAISAVSLPMWDLHWYHIVKEAASHSTDVLISGDGGDELFGGYTFRYENFLREISRWNASTVTPDQKIQAYLNNHIRDFVSDQEKVFGPRMKFSWKDIYGVLYPHFDNQLDPLEQVFLADYNGKLLYNFAQVSKPISSHLGITAVTPLLSPAIIKHAMKIRVGHKYNTANNIGKRPLRSILDLLGVKNLVTSIKAGFSPNTVPHWHKHGYDICSAYLDGKHARTIREGWISKNWVTSHLRRDLSDVREINKFLGLLAFEVWYRIFITKEHNADTYLS